MDNITIEQLFSEIENLKKESSKENANTDPSAATKIFQIASLVQKKYVENMVLKPEHAKAHKEGDFHIHDEEYYDITINCMTHNLGKMLREGFDNGVGTIRSPKKIVSATALTAIIIQSAQNNMFGGQAIGSFDKALAPFAEAEYDRIKERNRNRLEIVAKSGYDAKANDILDLKETKDAIFQAMEAMIYNLNTMKARSGNQVPFSSLNIGTDTSYWGRAITRNLLLAYKAGLGKGENPLFPNICFRVKEGINFNPDDPNYDLFRLAMEVASIRMNPTFSFMDASFNKEYGDLAGYMGCRTRVMANVNGPSQLEDKGNLFFTTINLPRLALKAKNQESSVTSRDKAANFMILLSDLVDLVIDQLLHRYNIVKKFKVKDLPFIMPYYMGGADLGPDDEIEPAIKNGTLSMGFCGLAECLVALFGKHHGESEEAQEEGKLIISYLRRRMDEATKEYGLNFTLLATPAESTAGRFAKLDKKEFGDIPGVTDREYYTNSFHVPVYYDCTISHKIDVEGPYHALTNAGHISYIELDSPPKDNINAIENILRYMAEADMGYVGINFPVDFCRECGFLGVIDADNCPRCNNDKINRTRRITGYMSFLDKFNTGKEKEANDRVSHGGRRSIG